jgi:type IV fimbrial biogenesis protein FimT
MIIIAIASVLLVIGIPTFTEFVANNRVVSTTNELAAHLSIARTQAVSRNIPVSICASADGAICGESERWDTGWIVFTDNTGVVGEVDGADEILRVYTNADSKVNILGDGSFVRFGPTGTVID